MDAGSIEGVQHAGHEQIMKRISVDTTPSSSPFRSASEVLQQILVTSALSQHATVFIFLDVFISQPRATPHNNINLVLF